MEITMDKNYIVKAAKEFEHTIRGYYENSKYNYIITENGKPLCWKNGCPMVFGDVTDATYEISSWREPFKNVSVVTEREILDTFCKEEAALMKRTRPPSSPTPTTDTITSLWTRLTNFGGTPVSTRM